MGKFLQISKELQPLIGARNLFSLSIFGIFFTDFLQTGYKR